MTTKPDDIPQDVMDASELAFFQIKAEYIGLGLDASPVFVIARAILKAKNDAYEEAAKAADGYRHKEAGFRSNEPDKSVYGWGTARREIAQSIRNLKHETEV